MDELLRKVLEQVPVIIVLSVGIYALWKEREKTMDDAAKDKKEQDSRLDKLVQGHKEALEKKDSEHRLELKELNAYVREREVQHLEVMKDVKALLDQAFGNHSD